MHTTLFIKLKNKGLSRIKIYNIYRGMKYGRYAENETQTVHDADRFTI